MPRTVEEAAASWSLAAASSPERAESEPPAGGPAQLVTGSASPAENAAPLQSYATDLLESGG